MGKRKVTPFMIGEWKILEERLMEFGFSRTMSHRIIGELNGFVQKTVYYHLTPEFREYKRNYRKTPAGREAHKKAMRKYQREHPEIVKKAIRSSAELDTFVLDAWSQEEAINREALTPGEIASRIKDAYVGPERVEKQMEQYADLGMFRRVKKNGERAYKPSKNSPYINQLDGLWDVT